MRRMSTISLTTITGIVQHAYLDSERDCMIHIRDEDGVLIAAYATGDSARAIWALLKQSCRGRPVTLSSQWCEAESRLYLIDRVTFRPDGGA